jgi:hypothetical protein
MLRTLCILVLLAATFAFSGSRANESSTASSEHQTLTKGQFRSLKVGMTKAEALAALEALEAEAAKPIAAAQFHVRGSNLAELQRVDQVSGFRVTDFKGFTVDVALDGDAAKVLGRSAPAESTSWFANVRTRADAITEARKALATHRDLVLFPIVFYEGDGWVTLKGNLADATRRLSPYDAWLASLPLEKPAGAEIEIRFKGGRVAQIDFRRIRSRSG